MGGVWGSGGGEEGFGEGFGLFEDDQGGLVLLVGRVAVAAEDALDGDAELGADVGAQCPVEGGVAADGFDEFAGDGAQGVVVGADVGAVGGLSAEVAEPGEGDLLEGGFVDAGHWGEPLVSVLGRAGLVATLRASLLRPKVPRRAYGAPAIFRRDNLVKSSAF